MTKKVAQKTNNQNKNKNPKVPFSGTGGSATTSSFRFPFLPFLLRRRYGTLACNVRIHSLLFFALLNILFGIEMLAVGEVGNNWDLGLNGTEPRPRGTWTIWESFS